jgi:hypothetical protein
VLVVSSNPNAARHGADAFRNVHVRLRINLEITQSVIPLEKLDIPQAVHSRRSLEPLREGEQAQQENPKAWLIKVRLQVPGDGKSIWKNWSCKTLSKST